MTIQEIINWFGQHTSISYTYFGVLVLLSVLGYFLLQQYKYNKMVSYCYSVLIYASVVPGLLSLILLLYGLFINKTNLLQVDVLVYYMPIVVSIINVVLINKTIPLSLIPGFDRLLGMFSLIIGAFVVVYILQRMFFGVFFVGSFTQLIGFFVVILIVLRYAWARVIK